MIPPGSLVWPPHRLIRHAFVDISQLKTHLRNFERPFQRGAPGWGNHGPKNSSGHMLLLSLDKGTIVEATEQAEGEDEL